MEGIFAEILNMSMISCIVIVAVMIIRQIFRRAPKAFFCILWAFVGFRLICPFTLQSVLCLIPDSQPITEKVFLQENIPVKSESPTEKYEMSVPQIPPEKIHDNTEVQNDGKQPVYSVPTEENKTEVSLTETLQTPQVNNEFLHFIPYIWAAGAALMFFGALIRYFLLIRRLQGIDADESGIYYSDRVDTPFILGVISPKIYLPYGTGETDKEYILAHEQAHIHRLDYLWKPIGFAILCLHWFNPFVWVAFHLFCKDIELACDERVVRDYSPEKRKAYSHTLVNFSVQQKALNYLPLGFGESGVKERVVNVLSYKKSTFWVIVACVVVAMGISVFLMTNPISSKNDLTEKENSVTAMTNTKKESFYTNIYSEKYTQITQLMNQIINDNLDKETIDEKKQIIYDIVNQYEYPQQIENMKKFVDYVFGVIESLDKKGRLNEQRNNYAKKINEQYSNLSEEQVNEIITLRFLQPYPIKSYPYLELKIAGIIDDSYQKLTVDVIKEIIREAKNNAMGISYIKSQCENIQNYPDMKFDALSLNTDYSDYVIYISNNNNNIIKIEGNEVLFRQIDDNDRVVHEETLYSPSEQTVYDAFNEELAEKRKISSENTESAVEKAAQFLSKYPELKNNYPNVYDILEKCMKSYPDLSDEQYKELLEVRRSDGWLYFPYKEAVIVGERDSSSPRMTLEDAKKVIEENRDSGFAIIVYKLSEIQPPDQTGGSGGFTTHFFLDDDGNERIVAIYVHLEQQNEIHYYHNGIDELLYPVSNEVTNFLEKYPELKNQYDKAESILDKCMKLYPNLSDEQYKGNTE